MKKLLFLFFAILFLSAPVMLFAAEGDPPGNPISLEMFASFTALVAGVAAVTQLLKKLFNTQGIITDIMSWLVGIVLGLIGYFFKLGMFAEIVWYAAILYGLLAGFTANKGFDLSYLFSKK